MSFLGFQVSHEYLSFSSFLLLRSTSQANFQLLVSSWFLNFPGTQLFSNAVFEALSISAFKVLSLLDFQRYSVKMREKEKSQNLLKK